MTNEEKAKAYDEALERARQKRDEYIRLDNDNVVSKDIEFIFPELKESEDENIRRELIRFVEENSFEIDAKSTRFITWLEKQGEQKPTECTLKDAATIFLDALSKTPYNNKPITDAQVITRELLKFLSDACSYNPDAINEQKPADKVEPKFNIGDWVVVNNCEIGLRSPLHIVDFDETQYRVEDVDGNSGCPKIEYLEELYRLWTIEDAKDGDILLGGVNRDIILMFRGIGNKKWDDVIDYHCYYDCHREDFILQEDLNHWGNTWDYDLKPATKEQRAQLFQKMKEEGYGWDAEKKELKKIEPVSAWSEDDEKKIMWLVRLISTAGFRELDNDKMPCSRSELIDWLKSLKPQLPWKPSEDQMEALNQFNIIGAVTSYNKSVLKNLYNDLKNFEP